MLSYGPYKALMQTLVLSGVFFFETSLSSLLVMFFTGRVITELSCFKVTCNVNDTILLIFIVLKVPDEEKYHF